MNREPIRFRAAQGPQAERSPKNIAAPSTYLPSEDRTQGFRSSLQAPSAELGAAARMEAGEIHMVDRFWQRPVGLAERHVSDSRGSLSAQGVLSALVYKREGRRGPC